MIEEYQVRTETESITFTGLRRAQRHIAMLKAKRPKLNIELFKRTYFEGYIYSTAKLQ